MPDFTRSQVLALADKLSPSVSYTLSEDSLADTTISVDVDSSILYTVDFDMLVVTLRDALELGMFSDVIITVLGDGPAYNIFL